jgi:signal transduction histidine kinase
LFHPFATDKQKGVGLGLPIVRKIVELHQGKIQVKSKINQGTKVSLMFPIGL